MTHHLVHSDYEERYEYHGNVAIEHIRKHKGAVRREWLFFDTAEEAVEFFNEQCA